MFFDRKQLVTVVRPRKSLVSRPEAGKSISGSGGLRKIRWKSEGSGKRGGLRVIYFWDAPEDIIYMLLIYKKSKQKDLTPDQVKTLRNIVKDFLK
jgi:hypothetical protein